MDLKNLLNNTNSKLVVAFVVAGVAYFWGVLQTITFNCEDNDIAPKTFAVTGFVLTITLFFIIDLWKKEFSLAKKVLITVITCVALYIVLFLPLLVAFGSLGSDSC